MSRFKKYNYIVNMKNGEICEATDFYFYPLSANDYASYYKNYTAMNYPLMAFIYLTNRCSDNCIGCFARTIEDGNAELDWSLLKALLIDLAQHGTKAIKLAGREPTSSPNLSKCLKLSSELGMKSIVISSGAEIDNHIDALSKYCTHLRLSLNTVNQDLHEKLHRPTEKALKFNDRIKYIQDIVNQRIQKNLITGATYLVRTPDDKLVMEYVDMCKELGLDYVRFSILDSDMGHWGDNWSKIYNQLLTKETEEFKIITHNPIIKQEIIVNNIELIDPAISSRAVIHANGKVNSCHEGWRGKWEETDIATFGNLNDSYFYSIWNGEKRKHFLDYIKDTHKNGLLQHNKCIEGNLVCANNCKYSSFNILQKWIISQVEKEKDSVFEPILLEQSWDF